MTTDIPLLDNFSDARIRRILFSKISFLVLWYFLVQVTNHQKFRVTMAAIDPSAAPQLDSHPEGAAPRATLKLVREPIDDDDDDESDEDYDDVDAIRARLSGAISDEEDEDEESEEDDEDSDEEKNGGPSDPARTKKARKEAAMREIKKLLEEEEMDLDNTPNGVNGIKANKGKGKATDLDEDSSEDEDLEGEMEEFVICTLDPEKVQIHPLSSRLNPYLFTNFFSELSAAS